MKQVRNRQTITFNIKINMTDTQVFGSDSFISVLETEKNSNWSNEV